MKAKVLIILPTDKFLHRKILEGILDYGRKHGPWQFHFETGDRYEQGLANGNRWGCGGIIATGGNRKTLALLAFAAGRVAGQRFDELLGGHRRAERDELIAASAADYSAEVHGTDALACVL